MNRLKFRKNVNSIIKLVKNSQVKLTSFYIYFLKVLCNIELQLTNKYDTEKRFLNYWSKLYSNQMLAGDDYKDIKKTIGIYILDYELENLKEIKNAYTKWQIVEVESKIGKKIILTEDFELNIIEIPKALRILDFKLCYL